VTRERPDDIAIATVTLVRDAQETPLLRRSVRALTRLGFRMFVCDGGSGDEFAAFLRELPNLSLVAANGSGLVGQVRASTAAAARSGAATVVYTEADKEEFFERSLAAFAGTLVTHDSARVTVAARSPSALGTFPSMQRFTETAINQLCERFLGPHGDYSYGPFAMSASLVPFIEQADDDLGWGWRHFIFAIAHRLGHQIVHVPGDYACPADQRDDDEPERLHRLRQLGQNVRGLEAGLGKKL
jgi:hypothetical protein